MKEDSVLFIVPYPSKGASNRLRVEQYLPYLDREGIRYAIRPFAGEAFYDILYMKGRSLQKLFYFLISIVNRFVDVFRALRYDSVFIHREALPVGSTLIEGIISKMGKRLIYDFDDAIFLPNTSRSNNYIERFKNPNKVAKIIRLSDHVIVGNRYLEEYARKFSDNVTVIPTPIDTDKYAMNNMPPRSDITIGWIGSFTTRDYLEGMRPVFAMVKSKYPGIKFKFIGNWSELQSPIDGAEYKEWSLADEADDIRSLDIGMMPMPDDMWTRGKCAFKIILYMACGIPVVSSAVGMNMDVIRDGENGFLARSPGEWADRLSRLIDDPGLRKRMGLSGRLTAEKYYSVKQTAPSFIRIIKKGGSNG